MKKDKEGYVLARVRAGVRPGFSGFSRGGRLWPSTPDGDLAFLHPDVYKSMKSGPTANMLFVDTDVDTEGLDLATVERVNKPVKHVASPVAAAAEQARRIDAEIEELEAAATLKEKIAKRDALLAASGGAPKKAAPAPHDDKHSAKKQ
jgi:hypothetical protein